MRQFFNQLSLWVFVVAQIIVPLQQANAATAAAQMRAMGDLKLIEKWKVGPVDTENGPSCAMIGRFEESSVLALSDNPQGRPSMAIAFAESTFQVGQDYAVTLRPENGGTLRVVGTAANENSVVVDLTPQKDFFATLAKGSKTLRIDTPVSQSTYDLASLNDAYAQVKSCFKELKDRPGLPEQQVASAKPVAQPVVAPAQPVVTAQAQQPVVAAANVEKVEAKPLPAAQTQAQTEAKVAAVAKAAENAARKAAAETAKASAVVVAQLEPSAGQDRNNAQIIWSKSEAQIEELNRQLEDQKQQMAAVVGEKKVVERKLLASMNDDKRALASNSNSVAQSNNSTAQPYNSTAQPYAQIAPAAGGNVDDTQSEALRNLRISALGAQRTEATDKALAAFDQKQAALKTEEQRLKKQRDALADKRPAVSAPVVASASAAPSYTPEHVDLASTRAWKAGLVAKQSEIARNADTQVEQKQQLTQNLADIHAQYQAKIQALEAERDQLKSRLSFAEGQLAKRGADTASAEGARASQLAAQLDRAQQTNRNLTERLALAEQVQKSAAAGQKPSYDQQIAAKYAMLSEKLSTMQANINGLEQKLKAAETEKLAALEQLRSSQEKLAAAEQALTAAAAKRPVAAAAPSPEMQNEPSPAMQNKMSALENEIGRLQTENKALTGQISQFGTRSEQVAQSDDAEKRRLAQAAEQAEAKVKAVQASTYEKLAMGQQELDRLRAENAQLKDRVATMTASAAVAQNRMDALSAAAVSPGQPMISTNVTRAGFVMQPARPVQNQAQRFAAIQPTSGVEAPSASGNRAAAFLDKIMSYHVKGATPAPMQKPAMPQKPTMAIAPVMPVLAPQKPVVERTVVKPVIVETPVVQTKEEPKTQAALEKLAVQAEPVPTLRAEEKTQEPVQKAVGVGVTPSATSVAAAIVEQPRVVATPVLPTSPTPFKLNVARTADEKVSAAREDMPVVASSGVTMQLPALLSKAGLANVNFAASDGAEKRWQAGELVGSFSVAKPSAQLRLQAENFMQRYKQDCPTALDIKVRDSVGGAVVGDASCTAKDNNYVASFAFVPRPGKVWVIGHSAVPSQAAQVKSLSDNVAFVLEKVDTIETASTISPAPVVTATPVAAPRLRFESLAVHKNTPAQAAVSKEVPAFETVVVE